MNGSEPAARFARKVFLTAGAYGIILIVPLYFLEGRIGHNTPPAITHPEYFYGFTGAALVWQFVYLLISTDPLRFRPMMPLAVLAKISFGGAALVLYAQNRLASSTFLFSTVDLVLAVLFWVSYMRTRPHEESPTSAR